MFMIWHMGIKHMEARRKSKKNSRKMTSRLKKLGIGIWEDGIRDVLMYAGTGVWIWLAGFEEDSGERQMMALLMGGILWGVGVTGNWWKIMKRLKYKTGMGMRSLIKGLMGAIVITCFVQYHTQNKVAVGPELFLWIWVYVFVLWGFYGKEVMKRRWKYTTKKKREKVVEDILVGLGIGIWMWMAGSDIKNRDWHTVFLILGGVMWGVGMSRNGWRLLKNGKVWICYEQKKVTRMKDQIKGWGTWKCCIEKGFGWVAGILVLGIGLWFVIQTFVIMNIEPIKMTGTLILYVLMVIMGNTINRVINILVEIAAIFGSKICRNIKVSLGKVTGVPKKMYEKRKLVIKQIFPIAKLYPSGLMLLGWMMAFLGIVNSIYFCTWERQENKILVRIWLTLSVVSWGLWKLWNTSKQENVKITKKEVGPKLSVTNETHTVITTRQKSKWIRKGKDSKLVWIPKIWEERKASITPKDWLIEKGTTNKQVNKEKFKTGGGNKLWNKVRQRAIGKEWWGCIPRLSAADLALWLLIKNINIKIIAAPQIKTWLLQEQVNMYAILNLGNHWTIIQRVSSCTGIVWDTYGISDKPKYIYKTLKELNNTGIMLNIISTGIQKGNNDRTCGYTVLRWVNLIKEKGLLSKKFIQIEGEIEATLQILEELHQKTGRNRIIKKNRKVEKDTPKETRQQKEEKKKRFLMRKGVGLVSKRLTAALHAEWVLEEEQTQEKRKKREKTSKCRKQWVNDQGNIWMMSTNIRGGMLDKIAHLSVWIGQQSTMPSVIALQETWLLESERQNKTIQMVVNKWLPEYRFWGTTEIANKQKGVGLLISRQLEGLICHEKIIMDEEGRYIFIPMLTGVPGQKLWLG